ncbi:MAG: hypothetical protein WCK32_01535 [Chlorobiaceae bacterium]
MSRVLKRIIPHNAHTNEMKEIIAAKVFACLILFIILFQLGLALGAPWGAFAWGGAYRGTLPTAMRLASAGSIFLLVAFMCIVLIRAGVMAPRWQSVSKKGIWIVVSYLALGVIANTATPSHHERMLWLPVTVLMLMCSTVVARSR